MASVDSAQAETKPRFLYRCSFCAKPQTEVKKLIAGPGVFICDECVGLCLPIIENAAEDSKQPAAVGLGPAGASTEQLVTVLKGYNGAFEAVGNTMQELVDILREREVSWAVIGEALGVSRQAAWKRFG